MKREESPEKSYTRAVAALAGGRVKALRADGKMMSIVCSEGGADSVLSPAGFTVRLPNRRAPFEYLPSLAPGVIGSLRSLAPGGVVDRPFHVSEDSLSRVAPFTRGSRWFWVSAADDRIAIATRELPPDMEPPAWPEPIEPWRPAERVYAHFPSGRACDHCHASFERFRLLGDVLVCSGCGCSSRVSPEELHGVLLSP